MSDNSDLTIPVSDADHTIGPPTAPVTLVEYGDYECPDCLNSEPMIRQLREQFGDHLRVVFRHFPQHSVHPHASAAAEAAEAAFAQGGPEKFWEMHRALFAHQKELVDLDLTHLALTLGLDPYRFQRDGESRKSAKTVRVHHEGGIQSGVKRTPTFFINGHRHDGHNDLDSLQSKITAVLGPSFH
jgi:protein-disulfide isomerase